MGESREKSLRGGKKTRSNKSNEGTKSGFAKKSGVSSSRSPNRKSTEAEKKGLENRRAMARRAALLRAQRSLAVDKEKAEHLDKDQVKQVNIEDANPQTYVLNKHDKITLLMMVLVEGYDKTIEFSLESQQIFLQQFEKKSPDEIRQSIKKLELE